ncbi:hypothetical protein F5Y18DRAFT_424744 [Xylariaceae sp. FL1019]|nr:hypothetical protein F5Y18DRAFT_424744 [Xylariaceae sp. FL1019]
MPKPNFPLYMAESSPRLYDYMYLTIPFFFNRPLTGRVSPRQGPPGFICEAAFFVADSLEFILPQGLHGEFERRFSVYNQNFGSGNSWFEQRRNCLPESQRPKQGWCPQTKRGAYCGAWLRRTSHSQKWLIELRSTPVISLYFHGEVQDPNWQARSESKAGTHPRQRPARPQPAAVRRPYLTLCVRLELNYTSSSTYSPVDVGQWMADEHLFKKDLDRRARLDARNAARVHDNTDKIPLGKRVRTSVEADGAETWMTISPSARSITNRHAIDRVVIDEAQKVLVKADYRRQLVEMKDLIRGLCPYRIYLTGTLPPTLESLFLTRMGLNEAPVRIMRSACVRPNIRYQYIATESGPEARRPMNILAVATPR